MAQIFFLCSKDYCIFNDFCSCPRYLPELELVNVALDPPKTSLDPVNTCHEVAARASDSDSIQSWESGPSEVKPDFSAVDLHKMFIKNQRAESWNEDDDEEEFWNGDDDSVTAQVGARATRECYPDSDSIQSWESGPSEVEPDFSAVDLHKMFIKNRMQNPG